jgi:hypothetical protein
MWRVHCSTLRPRGYRPIALTPRRRRTNTWLIPCLALPKSIGSSRGAAQRNAAGASDRQREITESGAKGTASLGSERSEEVTLLPTVLFRMNLDDLAASRRSRRVTFLDNFCLEAVELVVQEEMRV